VRLVRVETGVVGLDVDKVVTLYGDRELWSAPGI
jgi:hypothetical protein